MNYFAKESSANKSKIAEISSYEETVATVSLSGGACDAYIVTGGRLRDLPFGTSAVELEGEELAAVSAVVSDESFEELRT